MTQRSIAHATFVIERAFAAPPARVFAVYAAPKSKNERIVVGYGMHMDATRISASLGTAAGANCWTNLINT